VPAQAAGGSSERPYRSDLPADYDTYGDDDDNDGDYDGDYAGDHDGDYDGEYDGEYDADPADEPPAQRVSPAEAARVAQLDDDVLVIDGRPRYHLPGCVHLLGREHESLPVSEAVELGFSPCGLCEPDSTLLARVRRG
jgi:hypothetical protein